MRGTKLGWIFFLALLGLAGLNCQADDASKPAANSDFDEASLEFFEKEVRPILTSRCLECHGAGKGDPKGGLSLTTRAGVLKGGDTGAAIVPGNTKDSLLVSAIEYGDIYQMPPKSKLPANEIAVLTKWVKIGAPWPKETANTAGAVKPFNLAERTAEHWCWRPIANPSIPEVNDKTWPVTPIDKFILARLEARGLKPAGPAEKHALLRRVYFDVIGLPPSPDEVEAFVNDASPQAFEHVVDRLLDSVHFGERWGRHWLDLVRYAETRGHEFEPIIPNAWQYRDYVIRALNADVPYDRFLTEHIAGDLIEPRFRAPATSAATPLKINEAPLGTGFWFLGEEVHSPVDIRKDETDRMDNRLDVMSKTFLGLTVGCARCHDHKFDAISQRDYYALTGYLLSGSYRQVRVQTEEQDRQIAVRLNEVRSAARIEIARMLVETARPTLEKLDRYLLTAKQLVDGGIGLVDGSAEPRAGEMLFADFEGDTWAGWKPEGTAFGDRPPRKADNIYAAPLEGFRGERLVNSHRNAIAGENTAAARDAQTGRLISPDFTIKHNFIRFQVGGGAHAGRTCINLEVDGKTVRTATGQNSGTLRTEQWQVDDLRGKQAHIEIVDSEAGGWGHILVDQIVFTDDAGSQGTSTPKQISTASRDKVFATAAASGLDAVRLSQWIVELASAKEAKSHPLRGLFTNEQSKSPESQAANIVVDFSAARPQEIIQDGVSFGLFPARPGQLRLPESETSKLGLASLGGWQRDLFWKNQKLSDGTEDDHGTLGSWHRHGRMVRTPEFTLNSSRLWYLIRGEVRAYVAANSHLVIAGPLHGSLVNKFKQGDDNWHWVAHGLDQYKGHRLHVEFSPGEEGDSCIAMVAEGDEPPKIPSLVAQPDLSSADSDEKKAGLLKSQFQAAIAALPQMQDRASPAPTSQTVNLANWIVEHRDLFVADDDQAAFSRRLAQLREEESKLAAQVQWTSQLAPAMLDGNGIDEYLLVRGNSNTPRDPVQRRFLEALGGNPATATGSGRVELAQRMLQSPLAARVAVNRIWYHLMGRGIVPSVDNMGVLGQAPTHPELLDHLATQFVQDGWSTKRLMKSLLLSRTYQMSSHPVEATDSADPENLLWHRMPMKRLEGEAIRDSLLAVSGRLDRTAFGPSVPIHLTPFMDGRGRPGVSGPVDGNGRRSIYIAVRRNFLSPMMLAFDTPSPFSTVGRRTTSNVPAQALILMNDPLVVEMAGRWANRILAKTSSTPQERIDFLYITAFSRRPTEQETREALAFLKEQGERFGIASSDRLSSPQVWTDLCHVMFNVKEFVFVE